MSFRKIEEHALPDIQSLAILFEHEVTGAKVLYLKNDDQNKAFTIGFKTPPSSDNGIAHIIEHSVLNGSEKFPSKEPFVELIKGSLNTFVNAMTFADKTIYPVASTNDQDFKNLMSVYLDAVFKPKLRENPQILAQEGWHYHLEHAEDDLTYKGVVYNEMKGANASPERQLYKQISAHLLKDSLYQWDSGGDPSAITSLNQADFVAFHKQYYQPSNSYTVLYGDLDIDWALASLAEYFDQYAKEETVVDLTVVPQGEKIKDPIRSTYSLAEGDNPRDKDYLAMSWYVASPDEVLDGYGLTVLADILFGNNEAPLKKALLEANIGGDVLAEYDEMGFPRLFNIIVKYSQAEQMDRFRELVETKLNQLVEEGIDPQLIKASLNKINFQLKEMAISESNPRGVIYAMAAYLSWLYNEKPYGLLEFSKYLTKLEHLAEQKYFEKLIQYKLLANPQKIELVLSGEAGKNDRLEAQKLKQLQEYKASLSTEEITSLVDQTQSLLARQEQADSKEDLAKIPRLSKADLVTETEDLPLVIEDLWADEDSTSANLFYFAEQFTSGIDYLDLYLDISDIPVEDYSSLKLLASLLGKLPTRQHTAAELLTQIDLNTGGISAAIQIFEDLDRTIKPYFVLSGKALKASFAKLVALMKEIMLESQVDREKEILQRVQKLISNFEQRINFSANALASQRAIGQLSAKTKLAEQVTGIDYFNYLKATRTQLQNGQGQQVIQQLQSMLAKLLKRSRANALYIGDADRAQAVKEQVADLFLVFADQAMGTRQNYPTGKRQDEAFVTSQDVNYVAQASLAHPELQHSGQTEVLSTLLRFDYLWNNIRVKGGAYGASYSFRVLGDMFFSSYRDPNIAKTLATFQGTSDYLAQLDLSDEELEKNIIGTMSEIERPLSASDKGLKAFVMHQVGRTTDDIVRLKEEIIQTSLSDLRALAPKFAEVLADRAVVVIGNQTAIDQAKDQFQVIEKLY